MATDISTTVRSRRALLTAAVGAAAAAVAASVARVGPVGAADGDYAVIGADNEGENITRFLTEDSWALSGESTGGRGVHGVSVDGQGVHGDSTHSAGVAGVSEEGNGVHGTSTDNRGVWGESTHGPGVEGGGAIGVKAHGGTGVQAQSSEGYAVHSLAGRVRFDGISGIAEIPAGEKLLTFEPPIPVSRDTMVLLTAQTNIDDRALWYTKDPDLNEVTIHLTNARDKETKIAYLILEREPVE